MHTECSCASENSNICIIGKNDIYIYFYYQLPSLGTCMPSSDGDIQIGNSIQNKKGLELNRQFYEELAN